MFSRALSTILLITAVSAADICAYTTRSCTGSGWACCRGIPANTCCTWPTAYGWAVGFTSMPNVSWMGYMYGDTCRTSTGGVGTVGSSGCILVWNDPSRLASRSGSWQTTGTKRAQRATVEEECRTANVVGFTTEDGVAHEISVPEGRADEIAALIQAGNYETLLEFK